MNALNLTWRDVFDTSPKGKSFLYRDSWEAFKTAKACGYNYMSWNGLIYSVETYEYLDMNIDDLEPKTKSFGQGTPNARFHSMMKELEKRFPDPEPLSAIAYENRLYPMIDKTLEELKDLRKFKVTIDLLINNR